MEDRKEQKKNFALTYYTKYMGTSHTFYDLPLIALFRDKI